MQFLGGQVNSSAQPITTTDNKITLGDYIKAGYSFLQIRTVEDERAKSLILSTLRNDPKLLELVHYDWTSTRGLIKNVDDGEDELGATNIG